MQKGRIRRREKDVDLGAVAQGVARALDIAPERLLGDSRATTLLDLARHMAADGHKRDAPMRQIFARLGDKWSMLLLLLLQAGPFRHAALKRLASVMGADEAISQRMLTLRLRDLERDGFIARRRSPGRVPHVEYSLTELGTSLLAELESIFIWTRRHQTQILQARASFLARHGRD